MLDHNSLDDNKRKKEIESIQNDDSTDSSIDKLYNSMHAVI